LRHWVPPVDGGLPLGHFGEIWFETGGFAAALTRASDLKQTHGFPEFLPNLIGLSLYPIIFPLAGPFWVPSGPLWFHMRHEF